MRLGPYVLALCLAVGGCGGSGNTVSVTGKLLQGGEPYATPLGQALTITFVALEVRDATEKAITDNQPYLAEFDPKAATFTVPGPERRGIPPGKYRIAVTRKLTREAYNAANPQPSKKKAPDREVDLMGNKFGIDSSPITRDIQGSTDLTIDLDKP